MTRRFTRDWVEFARAMAPDGSRGRASYLHPNLSPPKADALRGAPGCSNESVLRAWLGGGAAPASSSSSSSPPSFPTIESNDDDAGAGGGGEPDPTLLTIDTSFFTR